MISLTIKLVPDGEITIEQAETGMEFRFKDSKGKTKTLGSVPSAALFYLVSFFQACIKGAKKQEEPDYKQYINQIMETLKILPKLEGGE